ncbi:MAG: helix-turn-helix domain-containing protein [Lachnospiraceae bacterium]|nr:helix-turn-helix domain-containing protein [Lachnospiraceae bacterium]
MNLDNTRLDMAYQLFFKAVLNHSFKELLSAAYSLLRFPVFLNDDMANNICQIPSQSIGDPDWDYIYQNGRSSEEHFYGLYTKYLSDPDTRSFPVLIEAGDKVWTRQFVSALHQKGRMLGYTAFLIGAADFSEEDIDIIRLFNRTCLYLLLLAESEDKVSSTQSVEYLHLLLETSDPEAASTEKIVKSLATMYKPGYVILICSTNEDQTEAVYLCNEIMRANSQTVATIYKGHMVTLVSEVNDLSLNYSPTQKLAEFFQRHHFYAAVSTGFQYLTANTIQAYYEQAYQTLICAQKQNQDKNRNVFSQFRDYAPEQLFLSFKSRNPYLYGNSQAFCKPVIYDIQKYDIQNGTDYFQTLKIYLCNMKNSKKTAEQLNIHANTVLYRLERLKDLFHINLNDGQDCILLLLSCLMAES